MPTAACCNWPGPPYPLPQGCNVCDTAYCRADMQGRCPNCPRDLASLLTRDKDCAQAVASAFRSGYDPTSPTGCRSSGSSSPSSQQSSSSSVSPSGSDMSFLLYAIPVALVFLFLRRRL